MQFTEGDLAIATKDFSDSSKLGAGGFGIVYKGFVNGCNIAVKKLTQVWKNTNKLAFAHKFFTGLVWMLF